MKASCPQERAYKVCDWLAERDEYGRMSNYHDKYKAIKSMCEQAADNGQRVTRGYAYYQALSMGWAISDAEKVFKRDHDFWSVLTRYMAMQSPKVTRAIGYCTAPIDEAPLVEIWQELMPPDFVHKDAFVAESWQQAREMCSLGDVSAA